MDNVFEFTITISRRHHTHYYYCYYYCYYYYQYLEKLPMVL